MWLDWQGKKYVEAKFFFFFFFFLAFWQNCSKKLSYIVKRNCSPNKNPQKKSFIGPAMVDEQFRSSTMFKHNWCAKNPGLNPTRGMLVRYHILYTVDGIWYRSLGLEITAEGQMVEATSPWLMGAMQSRSVSKTPIQGIESWGNL